MTESMLRALLEQTSDHALILLDRDGVVVDWRMGADRVFGYRREEMLGKTIDRLFTPEDQARAVPAGEVQISLRHGMAEDDRWMVRKDGARFWASGNMNCLRDSGGQALGFSKILRDRTDLKGQIEALRRRAEALKADCERKALALGVVAHELRNPLGSLANAVHLIQKASASDPILQQATQLVGRQVRYLDSIIEGLMESAQARTGKVALECTDFELNPLVASALEAVDAAIREKDQTIDVALPEAPIALHADWTRLKQVLVNLLSNASKFSERGTRIWIKAQTEQTEAVIRIEDQGRGIALDFVPMVFDLFSQAAAGKERSAGLGVGLSLVKDYVELHGGSVQVRSEGQGRGSEFIVRLPLAPHSR